MICDYNPHDGSNLVTVESGSYSHLPGFYVDLKRCRISAINQPSAAQPLQSGCGELWIQRQKVLVWKNRCATGVAPGTSLDF